MSTRRYFNASTILKEAGYISPLKATIETAFYANNVNRIYTVSEAYRLAQSLSKVIPLDLSVEHTEELGLPSNAKVLLANDGEVVGRTAAARRIHGEDPEEDEKLLKIVREAVSQGSLEPFISGKALMGLDEDFMVQAHIMMPEGQAHNMYSWLINFQAFNTAYGKRYVKSREYDENDIFIYFYPEWSHPDYPDGLAYFDPKHNCAAILGMHYFGEIKKGTLTLAWGTANRNNFISCHGGLKIFENKDTKESYVASFFGLSGSGKSTLTHANHDDKCNIQVLHDDAFIISQDDFSSIALEPAYFDKTSDYPAGHPEERSYVTVMNAGVTLDENGKRVLVTEDIRNGNGRTVKSRYATPNRVDKINEPIDAIYWIMKDNSLPPVVKINQSVLASTFGLTLATKRSSAENVTEEQGDLVIEPFANPFRIWELKQDYLKFKSLFDSGVDCYIINTGDFLGQDIGPEVTLGAIEALVEDTRKLKPFGPFKDLKYLDWEGYDVPFDDTEYLKLFKSRLEMRLSFIRQYPENLPDEIPNALYELINTSIH